MYASIQEEKGGQRRETCRLYLGGGGGLSAADGAGIRIYVVYASLF